MRMWLVVIGLTAIAVAGCGGGGPTDPDAKKAAEWIQQRGGSLSIFSSDLPLKRGSALPDGDFGVRRIDLNEKNVTDGELEHIVGLKNVQYLGLHSARITNQGLDKIAGMTSLQELELSYTRINDEGLKKLESLPRLKKLFLYGTKVSKEGAETFAKAKPGCQILR